LEQIASHHGWTVVQCYTDRISGSKESRPGLDALMSDARRRKFDVVLVWRFDRFARSVRQLVIALEEFSAMGIDFISTQEAVDTSTPMGKAMFTLIGAMGELERDVMRERILLGMAHAAKHGTKSGKPSGRPYAVFDRFKAAECRRQGWSWSRISKTVGANISTVRRACQKVGVGNPITGV
jgi:DNA invertase Pin-like site-specific DNA recombinase